MQIKFYGTSHGIPEKNRFCSCAMITVGENRYLIDCGAPVMDLLIRDGISPKDVKAVFITHKHGDHTNGLIDMVSLMSWAFTSSDPIIHLPEKGVAEALDCWIRNTNSYREYKYVFFEEGEIYNDGVIKVSAIQTQHTTRSFAFLVEADGKRVLFTGDIKSPSIDMPRIVFEEKLDAVICEGAHYSCTDHVATFAKILSENIYINHVAPKKEELIKELMATDPSYELNITYDGQVLEV